MRYEADVTMPNRLRPPLRAKKRSAWDESTRVMVPFLVVVVSGGFGRGREEVTGKTSVNALTVSQVKPGYPSVSRSLVAVAWSGRTVLIRFPARKLRLAHEK